jgi:glycosyltransferase involved in cell wall biosynthesis
MRGGEKVLEAFCELFPQADIFTHVYDPDGVSDKIRSHKIQTTLIQKLPAAKKLYKRYLILMPMALEELDLRAYDLVISCEAGPAKGVITRPDALHVCYCHTPMRYIWDQYHTYRENAGFVTRLIMSAVSPALRAWDVTTAARVDYFVANSQFVARRIIKFYRREATVIYPPVSVDKFGIIYGKHDYYLCAGQLVRYKRFDLAILAFLRNGRRLIVAGTGEETARLQNLVGSSDNIHFVGRKTDDQLRTLMQECRALIFPGEEDFGIIPVEVMACGRPVIAYGAGGVLETVTDGATGVLFGEQTVEGICAAVERFETLEAGFEPNDIRARALMFDAPIFKEKFSELIDKLMTARKKNQAIAVRAS